MNAQQLPPWSRTRLKKTIRLEGGAQVQLTKFPARRGYRLKDQLVRELGPLFVALSGGVQDSQGNHVPWSIIEESPEWSAAFTRALVKHLQEVDADVLIEIIARIVDGCAVFKFGEHEIPFEGTPEEIGDLFDRCFADGFELLHFAVEVVKFNFRPTSLVSSLFAGWTRGKSGQPPTQT